MCVLSVAMMVPIGVLVSKIKALNDETKTSEMQAFESTQSKAALRAVV
jgi:hypothetical protein